MNGIDTMVEKLSQFRGVRPKIVNLIPVNKAEAAATKVEFCAEAAEILQSFRHGRRRHWLMFFFARVEANKCDTAYLRLRSTLLVTELKPIRSGGSNRRIVQCEHSRFASAL